MKKPHLLGVRVHPVVDSRPILTVAAVVDVLSPITQLQRAVVEGFALPLSDRKVLLNDQVHPLYKAVLEIGGKIFEVDVLAHDQNPPCVVGADLVARAAEEEVDRLYEVFDDELTKALRNAAKNKKSTVLILGPYGQTLPELEEVRGSVRARGYRGVLVQDITDIQEQSLPEKMLLLGSIARFVLCLDARPSGHNVELETCARAGFVTAVIRPQGYPSTWMQADLVHNHDFMEAFAYSEAPEEAVGQAVEWAEHKVFEFAAIYDEQYPWRNKNVRLVPSE